MCFINYIFLFFCLIISEAYALNCRTDGGPNDSELKNIYQKCVKLQNNKNSTSNKNGDQEWKESRRYSSNDRDSDDNQRNNRYDWMGSTERTYQQGSSDSWMGNGYSRINNNDRYHNDGMGNRYDGSNDDRSSNHNDGSGSRYDKVGNYDRMSNRNGGTGHDDRISGRNDYYGNNEDRGRQDHLSGRNDFQNDNYDTNMYQYGYRSSTQTPHRYKRDRRSDNTGQRSQYNPNAQKSSGYDDSYGSDEKNSSNAKSADSKACALHCFLENLKMTAEDGMPDKYLVTHEITKDVKNEDLRDFLQEAIDECFQILENENIEEKCEFSKNLLLCLSEKGKANCDDWKDDLRF